MFFRPPDSLGFRPIDYLPTQELYRLVVDGRFHQGENGWKKYEARERGCLKAFFEALLFVSQNDGKLFSIEYLQTIHYLVDRDQGRHYKGRHGTFRERDSEFKLAQDCASVAGLCEFLAKMESGEGDDKFAIKFSDGKSLGDILFRANMAEIKEEYQADTNRELAEKLYKMLANGGAALVNAYSREDIFQKINQYINDYYTDMQKAKNEDDTLHAIARLTQHLEWLHPFADRNLRAIVLLTQFRLLMQNNKLIPVFFDPNAFDMHSENENVAMMKEGIAQTKNLQNGKAIFNFDTNTMSVGDKQQFEKICRVFTNGITPEKQARYEDIMLEFQRNNQAMSVGRADTKNNAG